MTTPSTPRKARLLGNGSNKAFPFTFKVFAASDIAVTVANVAGVETPLVLDSDYSVALNENQDTSPGGTITYPISGAALPVGSVLSAIGDLDYDQPLDIPTGGNFSPLALENQLDRMVMQIQQLKEEVDRSAKLPVAYEPTDMEAVTANIVRLAQSADNIDTAAINIAAINTVAADLNEPVSEINTVAVNIINVNAVGSNIDNVNAVAANLGSVNTVAADITDVSAVAGIAADVSAVAGVAASVPTVADIAAAVETVAQNVADVTNFADVYQGGKAVDPATRTDGSPLQPGDMYFNTSSNRLRVFGGTVWQEGNAGAIDVHTFSGDGLETSFALPTAPQAKENTQVFIGGIYQQKDQYSVTGNELTFNDAPPVGVDNIEVVVTSVMPLGTTDASLVAVNDAGGYFPPGSNVETALQQIGGQLDNLTAASVAVEDADGYFTPGSNVEDVLQQVGAKLAAPLATLKTVAATTYAVVPADSRKYLRFVADGVKTATISAASTFAGSEEIEVANRSTSGLLLLQGDGVVVNPVRGGTRRLAPGDTVKLKAVSAAMFDILYGTTSADALPLPSIVNNNSTFNDEGESTTGWTATGATLSVASSYLRATKTGAVGATCSITKPWTFTPANRDFILYGKVRASAISQYDATVITIYNGTKEVALWFGSTGTGAAGGYVVGASGIIGYEGATRKNALVAASGLAYNTTAIEFALQYDSKFGQLNCWFREADGRWKLKARMTCDFISHTSVTISKHGDAPTSSWFEFDYLTLCQPNIIAIGDSHCAGATLFDPNLGLALSNDESSWMRHSTPYPTLRNNLIVNKGVGGQTSGQILARVTEVTRESPRVVFLHASSNDQANGVSLATRTTNIQNTVNAMNTANESVVLLNALYATSANAGNPAHRDYMRTWWANGRFSVTGLAGVVDIAQPVNNAQEFLNPTYAQADTVHLNPAGYALVGARIAAGLDD